MCNCNSNSQPTLAAKIVKGAVAIAKNQLGIDLAPSQIVSERRRKCYECDKLKRTLLNQCSLCSCVIEQKTLQANETCPLGKW